MEKRGIMLLISITLLLLGSTFASATGDVAYIYRRQFKIDDNIINSFENAGLSVDEIQEEEISRTNLDQYKLIFIGDENFRNENQILVNNFPSIIISSHHADTWGITDNEGVSQLASNSPLTIRKDGRTIQVYTKARERAGGVSLPYYFLDKENKAPELTTIASTKPTSSGTNFGDVISYASPGTRMLNGRIQRENLCFFGIVESDFWTRQAEELFKECVSFVASECSTDLDCSPPELTGEPFCENNNVRQIETSFSCQNQNIISQCIPMDDSILIEECSFGCEQGSCKEGPHDVSLITFDNVIRKIRIKDSSNQVVSDFNCNEKYKVEIIVTNPGAHKENVTFLGSIDSIPINHILINNLLPTEEKIKVKTVNFSLEEGFYNITIEAFIEKDDNLEDNTATREIFVSCPLITCSTNEECGINTFIDEKLCTENNVTQNFQTFTCLLPGTPESSCELSLEPKVLETCSDICTLGECQNVLCTFDSDCNDQNPLTLDECINPGTLISECRNTPINCASDLDCGSTGFIGEEFCTENSITKNFQNATCNNPNTPNSNCELIVESIELNQCQNICFEGACIICSTDFDCEDNNEETVDICKNPNTETSFCENKRITTSFVCSIDEDCGSTTTLSQPFCSINDINQLVRTFTCQNPSTEESFCESNILSEKINSCPNLCSNGECISIECVTHQDCNDQDSATLDLCNAPGTETSFCTNNPINVICSSDKDCGSSDSLNNVCLGNSVTTLSQTFICFLPGTSESFCSSTITQDLKETCSQNEICSLGSCISQGECTPGQTRFCGVSNTGECSLGIRTCQANGFYDSCSGATNPTTEICDSKDNNCNGQIDENNICSSSPQTPQCDDGIDNDSDGFVDYPQDPGCNSRSDNSELPINTPQCNDGIDNDSDGFVDYPADSQCTSRLDTNEAL